MMSPSTMSALMMAANRDEALRRSHHAATAGSLRPRRSLRAWMSERRAAAPAAPATSGASAEHTAAVAR